MKHFIIGFFIALSFLTLSCSDPGKGKEVVLKITPLKLNFRTVTLGNTDIQTFILENTGNGELEITSLNVTKNNNFFKIKNDLNFPIKIKPGETYKEPIQVEYTAMESDEDTILGTIEVESNDSYNKVKKVFLEAQRANPILKLSVEEIVFDKIKVGEETEIELIVSNIGSSPLKFVQYDENGNIIAENQDAIKFGEGTSEDLELLDLGNVRTLEPVKIENGEEVFDSFTIKIKYKPTSVDTISGILKIYNNSTNQGPVKLIEIKVSSIACSLRIDPLGEDNIDFGERPVDSINSFNLVLRNLGQEDCEVKRIELSENSASEFSIELPNEDETVFPFNLAPNENYKFSIIYQPTPETGSGGALGEVIIEASDPDWENGIKKITVTGTSKEDDSPVCIIKDLYGGEPYFEVEPGQREAPECKKNGQAVPVCSNVQMISESYDPNPDNSGNLTHTWRVVEAPAAYTNPAWITFPSTDPNHVSNSDHHYVDFYVPYATPAGTKYLIELEVTNEQGLSSTCYATIKGLTGNSLHVELFWDTPSDVDLHVMNPTDQNISLDDIDVEYPSLDQDLEDWRERTNIEWWDTGDSGRDCHWRNCKGDGIEWGQPGREDNPSLDRDDIPGTGPENINIARPQEGWYRVSVHYYNNPSSVQTDAHVRVYCNGTVAYQNTAHLSNKDYTWLVNDIYWQDLGNDDGQCYIFSDGRIFDSRQGEDIPGYRGNLIEDIEPDDE